MSPDDTDTLDRLDARGRAAGAGLRAAAADRPAPPFSPDVLRLPLDAPARRARRRWLPVVGIAAAVLLVVGVAVALGAGRGGDDVDQVDSVGPPRRFLAGEGLPAGMAPTAVTTLADGSDTAISGPALLYGPAADDLRLTAAVASAADHGDPEDEEDVGLERVRLGARDAYRADGEGFGPHMVLVEVGDRRVFVGGLDAATVDAVATVVTVEGDRPVVPPEALPGGWDEQGELPELSAAGTAVLTLRGAGSGTGWVATYAATLPSDRYAVLTVESFAGTDLAVQAVRATADEVEGVEVRGHPALLSRVRLDPALVGGEGEDMWGVTWSERPGEVLRVTGSLVGRDQVLATAEGLVAVDAARWSAAELEALRGDGSDGSIPLAEGRFGDGHAWALAVEPTPVDERAPGEPEARASVRTNLSDLSSSSAGSGVAVTEDGPPAAGPPPAFTDGVSVDGSGPTLRWAYGAVRADVATVELRTAAGEVVARAEVARAQGYAGWLAELPTGSRPTVAVALDAAGGELERAELP